MRVLSTPIESEGKVDRQRRFTADFFARYLIRLIRRTKQPYRCEAARTTFAVSIDGGLYPCDNFVKLEQFRLGHVSAIRWTVEVGLLGTSRL